MSGVKILAICVDWLRGYIGINELDIASALGIYLKKLRYDNTPCRYKPNSKAWMEWPFLRTFSNIKSLLAYTHDLIDHPINRTKLGKQLYLGCL